MQETETVIIETLEVKKLHCLRCGGTWVQRYPGQLPRFCAKCNSPLWDKPRKYKLKNKN